MNNLTEVPENVLDPLPDVIAKMMARVPELQPTDVMVVGAFCRNVHHHALGHLFQATATHDLDLALALSSWDVFHAIAGQFPRIGDTGIRFLIAAWPVDLMPFGNVEDPTGTIELPKRSDSVSVWAFSEIFASALPLALPSGLTVKVPTVAGYAGAKIGAWLDRSAWHQSKDAADLALSLYWYAESSRVLDRLYDTDEGNAVLTAEAMDVPRAAARLLGIDVVATVGADRAAEMLARWPGNAALLARDLGFTGGGWTSDRAVRQSLIDALTRGLTSAPV